MAEGQHLSSELGVGARANQAQLGEEAGKGVSEAEEHGARSGRVGRAACGKSQHSVLSKFTASRSVSVMLGSN